MLVNNCLRAAFAAALFILPLPALAVPNPGDRAIGIEGYDAISKQTVSLSDHLGQWVFVDFWASWCGPCMAELPNLLESTAGLRKSGKLRIFTVTLDDDSTAPDLQKVIRDYKLTYPVVYDGRGWEAVAAQEWGVNSIPATYLIDPQGNVVATNLRGASLGDALNFFINHPGQYVPVGLRCSAVKAEDGSVALLVDLSSPDRKPLKVDVDYYHQRLIWADDDPEHKNRPVHSEYIDPEPGGPATEFDVTFSEFGEAVQTVHIPAVADTHRLVYTARVQIPGTEALNGGEGIWVVTRGRLDLTK